MNDKVEDRTLKLMLFCLIFMFVSIGFLFPVYAKWVLLLWGILFVLAMIIDDGDTE